MLNELRVQYARRHQFRTQGISVDGSGDHRAGRRATSAARSIGDGNSTGFDFKQGITQVDRQRQLDSRPSRAEGRHRRAVHRRRPRQGRPVLSTPSRRSTRTSQAKSGANPFGYTSLQQVFGNTAVNYNSAFYGLFVQDDWQLTPQIKVLYGLRYDLFDVPSARPFAPNPYSHELHDRQEQLRAARRRVVGARFVGAHGAARLDRADVRAAAARLLRQRDPEQRRSGQLHGADRRHQRRARRRFRAAWRTCRPASSCRDRASTPSIRTSRPSRRG